MLLTLLASAVAMRFTVLTRPNPFTQIWFNHPAASFMESSVLGNGRLGAMVFGKPDQERVVLNESTMWSGSRQDTDRPEAYKVLTEIRRLLLAGENEKAQDLTQQSFVCQGPGSSGAAWGKYQTFGDLVVESPHQEFTNYRRVLDLDRALATVTYEAGANHYQREAFTSAPRNVLVYRYRSDKPGGITFSAHLARAERAKTRRDGTDFVMEGTLDSGQPSVKGVCSYSLFLGVAASCSFIYLP